MLDLTDIYKSYEGQPLLNGISFNVSAGETVCLLGASGSGKSTILRIVAGLEKAEGGRVCWDGEDLDPVPAHLRRFGLVFQDYALFPHLTVAGNVAFGLKMQNLPGGEIDSRVHALLEQVNLDSFASRRVTELSGGEQQRVALARALAPSPRLLMFDEPLGALDRALKEDLLGELHRILTRTGIPAIYVTHDQQEAAVIADRILILHEGRILCDGSPQQVWQHPPSAWAARFLGLGNVLDGTSLGGDRIDTPVGTLVHRCASGHPAGRPLAVLIRPGVVTPTGENHVHGRVTDVYFQEDHYHIALDNGMFFHLDTPPGLGAELTLHFPPSAVECLE